MKDIRKELNVIYLYRRKALGAKTAHGAQLLLTVVFLLASQLLAVGCASIQMPTTRLVKGAFPETGVATTVGVGEVMASQYDYYATETATLQEDVRKYTMQGVGPMPAGTRLTPLIAGNQEIFCSGSLAFGTDCLADTNGDGLFDKSYNINNFQAAVGAGSIEPVRYVRSSVAMASGFKFELIYQGRSADVVRIAYREFSDSLARPAYSQDITYTLEPEDDTQVRFRDLVMAIHSAGNNEITYTVESGL